MAGLQTIKGTKRGTIGAYRITIKTPGAKLVNIQLSARQYTKRDAELLRGVSEAIEGAYRRGEELGRRTLEKLDLFPDFKKRLALKGLIDIKEELTLGELWTKYYNENAANWSNNTKISKERARRYLFDFSNSTH